jgi:F0F1-type ATP synthase assembly protein I
VRARSFVSLCLITCLSLSVWSQSQAADPTVAGGKNLLEGEQAAKAKNEVKKREDVKEVRRQGLSKPAKILIICGVVVGALIGMAVALACTAEGGPHC